MKVIDKISCPIDYDCGECEHFERFGVLGYKHNRCVFDNEIGVVFKNKNIRKYYNNGVEQTVTDVIVVFKNNSNYDYCSNYEPNK